MGRIPHVAENLIQHIDLEVRASSPDKLKRSIDVTENYPLLFTADFSLNSPRRIFQSYLSSFSVK